MTEERFIIRFAGVPSATATAAAIYTNIYARQQQDKPKWTLIDPDTHRARILAEYDRRGECSHLDD